MKLLFASSSSGSRGGGELYLLYLGRALANRGHQVMLWASNHPRIDELAEAFSEFGKVARAEYTNTYDLPGRSLTAWFRTSVARRVAAEWAALSSDLIHINKQNLEDGLDLLRAARMTNRPSVCTIHLTQSARYLKARFALIRDVVSRRALIAYDGPLVGVAESRDRDLADFLGSNERIVMIPNGVPLAEERGRVTARMEVRAQLGLRETDLLIIAVGRMASQKRPLHFLEVAAQTHARLPFTQFLWIGDGALSQEWDAQVSEKKLGDFVRRLPWQRDVPRWLAAADVFCHVAQYEGLPLALLEAMSAGLPCAVSEQLRADLGMLDASNSIAITEDTRWTEALRDREVLVRMGAAARALIEKEYSFELMAERYEDLYRRTAESRT